MTPLPDNAVTIPADDPYIAVWITDNKLVIRMLKVKSFGQNHSDIFLDKKILPHLVDVLIDIQNTK